MIRDGKGLIEKVTRLKERFGRRQRVMKVRGREYDEVLGHAVWVYRRPLCRSMTRAILTLQNHDMGTGIGQTLWQWRDASVTSTSVSRVVVDLLLDYPTVTVSQIEAQCRTEAISVTRTTVTKIMAHGVELKILEIAGGKGGREGREYAMTEMAREELIDRMTLKYTEPDVLDFAQNVMMIHRMRQTYEIASRERERNPNPMDADPSIFAMALAGDFDEKD